jgi:hypothetical protein
MLCKRIKKLKKEIKALAQQAIECGGLLFFLIFTHEKGKIAIDFY